jgi:hypothetical protein
MFSKWAAALVCLGAGVAVASQWSGEYVARLRAHHVRETIFVSAGNRRLAGFFDDLQPDPHWSRESAAKADRLARRCSAHPGLVARLLSTFEQVVYADGPCNATGCSGNYYEQSPAQPCGTNNVCTTYDATDGGGGSCNFGSQYTGALGCQGSDPSCVGACSVDICDNSQNCGGGGGGSSGCSCGNCGGCCQPLTPCTNNADCCSGNCSDSNNWCLGPVE